MADDELYEAQARDWLDSVDVPPPRLEVSQIVQIGQRQVRRRRLLAAGGTAAALAAVAAIPAAVPLWPDSSGGYTAAGPVLDCEVTQLAIPEGESQGIGVTAMDPTGRYFVGQGTHIGGVDPDTGEPINEPAVAVFWQDGEPTYIPALRGIIDAAGVNSHGVVVGVGQPEDPIGEDAQDHHGWVYADGDMRELPAPLGFTVLGVAGINDAGDIAGSVTDFGGESRAVVWRAVSADGAIDLPEILPAPEGESAHPADIAQDGTVVGTLVSDHDDPGGPTRPYLWEPDGAGRELPRPSGTTDGGALAISGEWVIGTAYVPVPGATAAPPTQAVPSLGPIAPSEGGPPARVQLPVRWNLRTGAVELVDPGAQPWHQFDISPNGASDSGDTLVNDLSVLLLLRGDQWFTLPFDGLEASAYAISPDGRTIAGEVYLAPLTYEDEAERVPVVWHC
jgi:hypothetical protein